MAKDRGWYVGTYVVMLTSPEYEALTLEQAAVLQALRFWPDGNRVGIFPIFREVLAHYSKVPLERLQGCLRALEAGDWIVMEGRWVWIRNFLRFDPNYAKENAKQRAGIVAVLKGLPRMSLVEKFIAYYIEAGFLAPDMGIEWVSKPILKGIEDPPKEHRSPLPLPLPLPVAVTVTEPVATPPDNEPRISPSLGAPPNGHVEDDPILVRAQYADAVWTEFLRVGGLSSTRIMSPGEYETLRQWIEAEIPLRVVLTAIAETKGRGNTLGYYGPAVCDEFDRVQRGRSL